MPHKAAFVENTQIGIVRWRTDHPRRPEEFGEIEIICRCSAEVDVFRLSFQDLQKFLVEEEDA